MVKFPFRQVKFLLRQVSMVRGWRSTVFRRNSWFELQVK